MGKTAVYQVEVKESPVDSIDIVKMPDVPEYSRYFFPDLTTMQLKFNYKDGTSKLIDLGNTDIHNYLMKSYDGICFYVDGHKAVIYRDYESGFKISYLGTEKVIDGIKFRNDKYVKSVMSENLSLKNPQGAVLKIKYEDRTEEDIKLNKILFMEKDSEYSIYDCMAVTDKGLLRFTIYGEDSYYGNKNTMYVCECEVKVDVKIGDANGDGEIDILDAANIQKYTASKAELTQAQLKAADVNGDGSVDILDATQIQKFAAGKITEFKKAA